MGLWGTLRAGFTAKNIIATVAAVASLTGTSYAAKMYGAKNFKAGSITGIDVGNRQLFYDKFSDATTAYLHSRKGEKGAQGIMGNVGNKGSAGFKGSKGAAAPRAYSFIKADDSYSLIKSPGINPPNGQQCSAIADAGEPGCLTWYYPRWNYDCGATPHYCNITGSVQNSPYPLNGTWYHVMYITAGGANNGGYLTLDRPGNIVVTASITLWHQLGDEHSRATCKAQVHRTGTPQNTTVDLGTPTTVSSNTDDQLVHMTVTGGYHFETPGQYDFQIVCRELDDLNGLSQFDDWWFDKGNVNAISTEV